MNTKNKLVTIFTFTISCMLCICLLSGCGSGSKSVSMFDLRSAMLGADTTLPEMKTVNGSGDESGDLFSYISDMDYSKVEDYFLAYAESAKTNPQEIAVIALKDSNDVAEAEKSIKAHVQSRIQMYAAYEQEQVKPLEDAIIFTQDQYVVLIVANNGAKVKSAFQDFVSSNQK